MGTTADKLNKVLETKEAIRTAINNKGGTLTTSDKFSDYATAIDNIQSGSANEPITITQNGTYTAPEGVGYSPINVNVPSKEEETKSITITENGTTTVLPTSGKVLSKVDITTNVPQSVASGTVKKLLDTTKSTYCLFYGFKGTSVDGLISYNDTSNVTNMANMFRNCPSLTTIPQLDTSKVTNMINMFDTCKALTTIPQLDTSSCISMNDMFYGCKKLTTIPQLDMSKAVGTSSMFANCQVLTYLKLLNVKSSVQIGSGTDWGHLIEKDCLIQIISELIKPSSGTRTLTMGTANKAKIADTYVKLLADDGTGKYPFEVCTSTDEGAMTIEAYCNSKNWTLA